MGATGVKLSLQNRIITLVVIFSILLISVFTFIQLNNQLTNISRYNTYHANLSSIILKNNLEAIIRRSAAENSNPAELMGSSLKTLKEAKVIEEALVFEKNGSVVAATSTDILASPIRYKDLNKWDELKGLSAANKWFISDIDSISRRLCLFVSLRQSPQEPQLFVAKITYSLGNIQEALILVYKPVIISTILIVLLNILLGYLLSKGVIGPIRMLNEMTKIIAGGDLSVRTTIHTNDELQELGETFNYMTEELVKMKDKAENANPLTKLPGNIIIQEQVEERIKTNQQFMVIYCDLDNFKAYNDKYGIAQGDEAIKLTSEIFKAAVKERGFPNDFVGHEGGDDFILLTSPERSQEIADFIIKEFDQRIRSLYSPEDLAQGHIVAHGRDGSIKQFPIMTISLAGVTNAHRVISNYAEVTNIAAELKKKAKAIDKSVFVIDKRTGSSGTEKPQQVTQA